MSVTTITPSSAPETLTLEELGPVPEVYHITKCVDHECNACPLDDVALCGADISGEPYSTSAADHEMCVVCVEMEKDLFWRSV